MNDVWCYCNTIKVRRKNIEIDYLRMVMKLTLRLGFRSRSKRKKMKGVVFLG